MSLGGSGALAPPRSSSKEKSSRPDALSSERKSSISLWSADFGEPPPAGAAGAGSSKSKSSLGADVGSSGSSMLKSVMSASLPPEDPEADPESNETLSCIMS